MFLRLQLLIILILLIGIILIFGKKLHKSRAFVIGLSLVLGISAIALNAILEALPMPTETIRIEAVGSKNDASQGCEVGFKGVIVGEKKYILEAPEEGTWIYSKNDMAYLWLEDGDKRLTTPVTEEITIKIPVGARRRLIFQQNEHSGMVAISYGEEERQLCDLYGAEASDKEIFVPDSNWSYIYFVKLCRLGGYILMVVSALGLAFFLTVKLEKEQLIKLICISLSAIAALTFFLKMGLTARSGNDLCAFFVDFNQSFTSGNFLLSIVLVPMFYKACTFCIGIYRRRFTAVKSTICISVPAGIFAVFMVIGNAFASDGTLRPIFENELQIAKSLFGLIGYFAFFFCGIIWIFNCLDHTDICLASEKKHWKPIQTYLDHLKKRPFITAFVTLFILYIPYIVVTYPALLMGDAPHQIRLIYGIFPLDNAHPITHTMFLGLCVKMGCALFGSVNIGFFIYSMLQFLFVIITVACVVKLLISIHVSESVSAILILYYIIHPRIQNYMFLLTKDVINALFLLIFIVSLYMLLTQKQSMLLYIILGISDFGALLFRNDSSYIIIISLVLIFLFMKDYKKQIAVIAVCTLCFTMFWNKAILPLLGVSKFKKTGPSNMSYILVSTMVQQTGRYLRDAGDEVTEEEKAAISAYFEYDKLIKSYTPNKSDKSAWTIKKEASKEDMKNYMSVWFKMFFKHPEIYIEATLHHKYDFLYPCVIDGYGYAWSADRMVYTNQVVPEMLTISYPKILYDARMNYEALRESIFSIPVINIPKMTSTYFWTLFIWLFYCIYRKNKTAIAIMMPLLILVLSILAGPDGARYFRYMYPYALCLPIVILLGLCNPKEQDSSTGANLLKGGTMEL